jgi:hypothetical protein
MTAIASWFCFVLLVQKNMGMKSISCTMAMLALPMISGAQNIRGAKDAAVWAVDDTVNVSPLTGNLLSEGADVYAGRSPATGHYRESNNVWDAQTRTVKIFGSRNEFVAFQVVIEKKSDNLHKIFVNATDLTSDGARIAAEPNIRLFKQIYVDQRDGWYPDPLEPLEILGAAPMELPDTRTALGARQKSQSVWVDVYIPHETPPGKYRGEIMVAHRATDKQAVLKLELEVGPLVLSDKLGLDVDLMNYGFVMFERGWPDLVADSPRYRAIEREFFRLAHAHRMTFALVPYNHDGIIPKGIAPVLAGSGNTTRVADWSAFDARYGPVLSGQAFSDLPRSGQPVEHFFLPYNLMWPSDYANFGKPVYRTESVRVGAEYRRHLAEKGWTKPTYQIYYNQKEAYGFFPFNLDEPTREKDMQALQQLAEIDQEAFPKKGPVKVALRVDVGHLLCKNVPPDRCSKPSTMNDRVVPALDPWVSVWNFGSDHFFFNAQEGQRLKAEGKTVWFYRAAEVIQSPLVRSVWRGWQGFRYGVDGTCYWNATDWVDWNTDKPFSDPYSFSAREDQGKSLLLYPGSKFGYDGPIPSIRFKAIRRGLQDFEYLKIIEAKGLKSHTELVEMMDRELLGPSANGYAALRRTIFDLASQAKR